MHFRSALTLGSLALQASAFLIPASVEKGVKKVEDEIHRLGSAMNHRTLQLECPDCPFKGKSADASLSLNFDITDDDKVIQINGQTVFPPPQSMTPATLYASQVRKSDGAKSEESRLGYALEVTPMKLPITDISGITLRFTILDLEGASVKVDTVNLNVVESWGKLHLVDVHTTPFADSPGSATCHTSLCRVKAIIADRLKKMADAAKAQMHTAKTWFKGHCGGNNKSYKYQPAGERINAASAPSPEHIHHEAMKYLQKFVHFFIHYMVIPGIAAFVGLMTVSMLAFIALRNKVACETEVFTVDEEKARLMDEDVLPVYEAGEVVIEGEKF